MSEATLCGICHSKGVVFFLRQQCHRAVLQAGRKSRRARRLPGRILDVRRLVWHVLRVVVEKQMVSAGGFDVGERRRAFARAVSSGVVGHASPGAEEAVRRDLLDDLLRGLVLEEAGKCTRRAEILEFLVDQRCVRERQVVARFAEGSKIGSRRVTDFIERRSPSMRCV